MYSLRSAHHEVLAFGRSNFDGSRGNASIAIPRMRNSARGPPNGDAIVEIRCLGHFSLRQHALSTPTPLKVNSRPAALLLLLIAAGPEGIEKIDAEVKLWPQAGTAPANSTLDTTLYRLRKLLGSQRGIEVTNGMVRLDEHYVSVDAWTFVVEAEVLNARLQSSAIPADSEQIAIRCERLFDLYKGPFLAQDLKTPWVMQMRDSLQSKFFRAIKLTGAYWQAMQHWDRAALLYERALELDNLAEEIHRELMRCYLARRESADAVRVFRRCRELLSVVLGVLPSEATETLYRQALAEPSPP